MRNTLITIIAFGSLLLGGCQSGGTTKADSSAASPAAEAAKPALS